MKISADYKSLISNFFSLSALQVVNMILPLLTLPYLVRILGVETFGLLNFSLAVVMFLNILVSFGFELSATRDISVNRDQKEKVTRIFSAVMLIKLILLIISFVLLCALLFTFEKFGEHYLLYLVTYGVVVGNFLFPAWFFQGMEDMKYITFINVGSKVIFTGFIFLFVQERNDFLLVPLFNSLGAILGGVYAVYLILKKYSISFAMPTRQELSSQFRGSTHFFFSRIANDGSKHYAVSMIGIFFGNTMVGYFSIVAKLFYAFMSLGGTVSQTLYPYMSRTRNLNFYKKIFFGILSVALVLLIPLMVFNELFLDLLFDVQNETLSKIFIIIFSAALFGIASALLGYPLLAAFGFIKEANNSLIVASFVFVGFITLACIFQNIYFVSASLLIFNLTAFLLRTKSIYKQGLWKISSKATKALT
ncbi:oligosaccharide flippase family protein [Salinimicrobium sp. TH3]|uniref:oligosaccharide flippase family protein n=1 Tax=Salinimicrobium sp. TH3 TaxID=2997342 RepID=UPI00227646B7|nr:oligosaccharide flippase family protein [Salinimicrobium sp. TH3]MCY2687771.1 oligosaccharide flippase family protein [Salinimicrobium sp. TH3]